MSSPISSNSGPTAKSPERIAPGSPFKTSSCAGTASRRFALAGDGDGLKALPRKTLRRSACAPAAGGASWRSRCSRRPMPRRTISMTIRPSARADYVFGCMKANGETQELLQKCSCSIDVIASIIPYDQLCHRRDHPLDVPGHRARRFRISIDRTGPAGPAGFPAGTGGSGNPLLLTGRLRQAERRYSIDFATAIRP